MSTELRRVMACGLVVGAAMLTSCSTSHRTGSAADAGSQADRPPHLDGSPDVDGGPDVLAYCCRGDSMGPCGGWPGGPAANDCSFCGGPTLTVLCSSDPSFECSPDEAVECPEDVIYPTRPDAGTQDPADCPMAAETCVTQGGEDQICIPGGIFVMGDEDDPNASPPREVYVSPFWMDRTPVTVADMRECLAAAACSGGGYHLQDDTHEDHPMRGRTLGAMEGYCEWTGGRLPTEAEWERAARGDDGRTYPWGEDTGCAYANWAGCATASMPVEDYPLGASPYGVLDMIGNAAEVTQDGWVDGGYDAYWSPPGVCDPMAHESDGASIRSHVLRGCDSAGSMEECTAFHRSRVVDTHLNYGVGFRCVRDGVPQDDP
jgi:formylglycine-generating enzyme